MDSIHVNISFNLSANLMNKNTMGLGGGEAKAKQVMKDDEKAELLLLGQYRFKSMSKQVDIIQKDSYIMPGSTIKVINEIQKFGVFDMDDKNINHKFSICDQDCFVNLNMEFCDADKGKISMNKKEATFKKEAFSDELKIRIKT